MIEYFAGLATAAVAGALAYGDIRYRIGKLESKMDLIYKNITIIMDNNREK